MFLTVHASSGIIAGILIQNPVLAFITGFISHFIIDAIPHGDTAFQHEKNEKERIKVMAAAAIIDGLILVIYLCTIFYYHPELLIWSVVAGILGAIIPDFLMGLYMLTKIKIIWPFYRINYYTHYFEDKKIRLPMRIKFWSGFAIQILFFSLLNYFIFQLLK